MKLPVLYRTVPRNRLLFFAAIVLPFALLVPVTSPAVAQISFVAIALTAIADAWIGNYRKGSVRIVLPALLRLSKEREGSLPLRIQNPDQNARRIRIGLPFPLEVESPSYDQSVQLPQGSEYSHFEWPCKGIKRGKYTLNHCYVEYISPLGLWNLRSVQKTECELRVYPNLLEERKKLASRFLNRDEYGSHSRKMVGQGREFEKLREYVPGDAYDQLHWKATAKRGRPITKVFQIERTQEVYVVVDFSRRSARQVNHETALEFFLRSALILGMVAQQQGDLFGAITLSNRVQGFLRAGNGKAHYHACRDLLYTLQPQLVTPDYEDLFSFVRLRLRRRALLVVLTDLNDPMLAESFVNSASLVARHHLLLVNMIRPEGALALFEDANVNSVDSVYERLSGHIVWENLKDLQNVLHRYGIPLSQLHLSDMSVQLVNQYFAVKERQLL
ncbi:DUF58 domain-containing protein [bacterium]|nr:DUF58 domain-containing protein [bacterium]